MGFVDAQPKTLSFVVLDSGRRPSFCASTMPSSPTLRMTSSDRAAASGDTLAPPLRIGAMLLYMGPKQMTFAIMAATVTHARPAPQRTRPRRPFFTSQ